MYNNPLTFLNNYSLQKERQKTIEVQPELHSISIDTIKSTTTPRALFKILNTKISRSNPDGKPEIVAITSDLSDVEPEEEHFDANTLQVLDLVLGYHPRDCGFVLELVTF